MRQQHPHRAAERTGEVGDARVHADHEIEHVDERRHVVVVDARVNAMHRRRGGRRCDVARIVVLQREPRDVRAREHWREQRQRQRAAPIVGVVARASPGEADAGPAGGARMHLALCRVTPLRIHREIGRGDRRCRRRRLEKRGQRQQRHVRVGGGPRRAALGHRCDTRHGGHERGKLRRHRGRHVHAAFGERARIADELQRIAEALLGEHDQSQARRRMPIPPGQQGSAGGLNCGIASRAS